MVKDSNSFEQSNNMQKATPWFLHPVYVPIFLVIFLLILLGISLLPKTLGHPPKFTQPIENSELKGYLKEQIRLLEDLLKKTCEENNVEFGSGLGGTASPAETSKSIAQQTILETYISGKSYAGSDGQT